MPNTPFDPDTHYGVELDFGDHKEIAWWWGQPDGFWSWYDKIGQDYHPRLQSKRPVLKHFEYNVGKLEVVRHGSQV